MVSMEMIMYRTSLVATVAIMLSGAAAAAAELPTYEIIGFPLTEHQLTVLNSSLIQERSPAADLTIAGIPASPAQIAVLTPRPKHEIAATNEGKPTPARD
jgi:hypothetical protein